MDDATVEAIARERYEDNDRGYTWRGASDYARNWWVGEIRRLAPIFAKHLPDPRPTEAEVRSGPMTDGEYAAWTTLREFGCFRPEPEEEAPRG